jgi:hypothetical protein
VVDDKVELFNKFFTLNHDLLVGVGCNVTVSQTNELVVTGSVVARKRMFTTGKLPINFEKIEGRFEITGCDLTSLIGSPAVISGEFDCPDNLLSTLEHGPSHAGSYYATSNPLVNLDFLPNTVSGSFSLSWNKNLNLLRLLVLNCSAINIMEEPGRGSIFSDTDRTLSIYRDKIRKFTPIKTVMWECQNDLIQKGFESNAKW